MKVIFGSLKFLELLYVTGHVLTQIAIKLKKCRKIFLCVQKFGEVVGLDFFFKILIGRTVSIFHAKL